MGTRFLSLSFPLALTWQARLWRQQEQLRQAEAAAKIQSIYRAKRIRQFVGFRGETRNGQAHGHGRMVWPDGSCFEGEWAEGVPHGEGEVVWADGSYYQGAWADGGRHGYGLHESATGEIYVGEWSHDVPHGRGELQRTNGSIRRGMWVRGKAHGMVEEIVRSGDGSEWISEFIGRQEEDVKTGVGRELTGHGEYEGEWMHGMYDGVGRYESSTGWVYRGGWSESMRHGKVGTA